MLELFIAIVGAVLSVGGAFWAVLSTAGKAIAHLDHRFDTLEDRIAALQHRQDLDTERHTGQIERLDLTLHQTNQALDHAKRRLQAGLREMSQSLQQHSQQPGHGKIFIPKPPDAWLVDDPRLLDDPTLPG
jgi:prefoldin subunit 5